MARWRQPVVIWLRRTRTNQYWKRRRQKERAQAGPHWRMPWGSAALYGSVLAGAALVLWKVPPQGATIPVTSQLIVPARPSWLDRTFGQWQVRPGTLRGWLNLGVPLLGLMMDRENFRIRPLALAVTGLRSITGVPLNNLRDLLRVDIPDLALVPPSIPVKAHRTVPKTKRDVRPRAQEAIDPTLPGDHGRIWAELGAAPLVGIYQTHSHESFWQYVPAGSATPYSSDWSKTIVQVGWWLAEDLHAAGAAVVQSRVDNMAEGLLASYNRSYYTAKQLLKWYPTVHMLIDLHRSPNAVPPAVIQGTKVSKITIVVGTNKLLPNEYWHQNLEAALKLSKALARIAPGILNGKGIDMVPYRYNQQLMPADLMIEVGGPNSTLAEERYAVHDLAEAIADVTRASSTAPKSG